MCLREEFVTNILGAIGIHSTNHQKQVRVIILPFLFMVEFPLFIMIFMFLGYFYQGEKHALGNTLIPFGRCAGALPEMRKNVRGVLSSRKVAPSLCSLGESASTVTNLQNILIYHGFQVFIPMRCF